MLGHEIYFWDMLKQCNPVFQTC